MATDPVDVHLRVKRNLSQQAVLSALGGQWKEAVDLNQAILRDSPDDVEALNRLGKAYLELRRLKEAKDAFQRTLKLSPSNPIAKKNLQRLAQLRSAVHIPREEQSLSPQVFIEEGGKTSRTTLVNLGAAEVLSTLIPGDRVLLRPDGPILLVETLTGEYIGQVGPKLGLRLTRLIQGGNQYEAITLATSQNGVTLLLREIFQHPNQIGVVSFPSKTTQGASYYTAELGGDFEPEDEKEATSPSPGLMVIEGGDEDMVSLESEAENELQGLEKEEDAELEE